MSEGSAPDVTATPREPRRVWPWLLGGLVLAPVLAWFLVDALARGQAVPWEPGHPVRAGLEARHPPRAYDAAAREWVTAAKSLGVSIGAPAESQGISPTFGERVWKFERMSPEETARIDSEARAKAGDIDLFVDEVNRQGAPRWSSGVGPIVYDTLDQGVFIHLHELLLARARTHLAAGDERAALSAVEAAWALAESLVVRPKSTTHVTGQVLLWRCLDVLRETNGTPEWCARIAAFDVKPSSRDAGLAEAWATWESLQSSVSSTANWMPPMSPRTTRVAAFVARPYEVMSMRASARRQLALIDELVAAPRCTGDPIDIAGSVAASVPRWDVLGGAAWSNPSFTWVVAAVTEHELEVTRLTWELRGTPCPVGPDACAVEGWTERVAPDGSRILELPDPTPATRHLEQALTRTVVLEPGPSASANP